MGNGDASAAIPERIAVWMEKFNLNAKSLDKAHKDEAVKEAAEVAKLLAQLEGLPNFADLLKKFRTLADQWKEGTVQLQKYKAGGAEDDHDKRVKERKSLRRVLKDLRAIHAQLSELKDNPPQSGVTEVAKALAEAENRQSDLSRRVRKENAPDIEALDALAKKLALLKDDAAVAMASDTRSEEEALVLAGIRALAQEQVQLFTALQDRTRVERATDALKSRLDELNARIDSNLTFARKAPNRADVVAAIEDCDRRSRAIVKQAASASTDAGALQKCVDELTTLETQSRGLMSTMAKSLQAAGSVDAARQLGDVLRRSQLSELAAAEVQLARVTAVDQGFDASGLREAIVLAREAVGQAHVKAYELFAAVTQGDRQVDDLLGLTRTGFDESHEAIADLRTDIDVALRDLDQVRLRVSDLKPLFDKACQVPQIVEGRKDLEKAFQDAQDKPTAKSEKLAQLNQVAERCKRVLALYEEGLEEGGGDDYWKHRELAQTALTRERDELALARSALSGAQRKLADKSMEEAELYFRRDDIEGFKQAVELLKIVAAARQPGLTKQKANYLTEAVRMEPMVASAAAQDKALATQFETLKTEADTNGYQPADLQKLRNFNKSCAEKVRATYKLYTDAVRGASRLAGMARRLRDLTEDEAAPPEQQKQVATMKALGAQLMARYDKAITLGDRGTYPEATAELNAFIKEAQAREKESNKRADALLAEAASPVDADGKPLTWNGPSAKVKDRKYGFNTTRDAMRYAAGQEMTADGTLVVSAELDEIGKYLDFKLKKFREMCNLGMDPLSIAPKVFAPVEENFWPPEAVRIMVAFRAAEREFEEEALVKEAKALGLKPELMDDRDKIEAAVEKAKEAKKLPDEFKEALKAEMKKEGIALATTDLEKVGQMLGLANLLSTTTNFGIDSIGTIDVSTDAKKVGVAGSFGELGATVIKTGMSVYEFGAAVAAERREKKKDDFRARKEDEVISPVKAKVLEYERNRAIAQMVNNASDAVLNALSAGGNIPGANIVGDVKALALACFEAGRYFAMLEQSAKVANVSKRDPDSITYLGLARQAKEEGIAGGMKCFEAACKILKLVGDVVQLSGQAAPAGFAINAASQALELGGKVCFQVYSWKDAASQIKFMEKARRKPPDYQAVAAVFSNTRKYARYCIAWGCMNDDPWARQWVMSRGLTDADLDSPETGTAIIREYINTTQEGMLGSTQSEDPETFGDSLPGLLLQGAGKIAGKTLGAASDAVTDRIKGRNRSLKAQYFDAVSLDLTAASWQANVDLALANGLYKSSSLKSVKKRFSELEQAMAAFDGGWRGKTSVSDEDDAEYGKLAEACRGALDELHAALCDYEPGANPKGAEPHQGMKLYVGDLLAKVGQATADHSAETDRFWVSSRGRRAGSSDPAALKKIEEDDLAEGARKLQAQVTDFNRLTRTEVERRLKSDELATPLGDYKVFEPAHRAKIVADAVVRLELDPQTDAAAVAALRTGIDQACAAAVDAIVTAMSGVRPAALEPGAKGGKLALSPDFAAQYEAQRKSASRNLRAALNAVYAEAAADKLSAFTWNADGSAPTPLQAQRIREFVPKWDELVTAASDLTTGGWVKTGAADEVRATLGAFAEVDSTVGQMLAANTIDSAAQGVWRIRLASLRKAIGKLPSQTRYGTTHQGMLNMRARMLKDLQRIEVAREHRMKEVGDAQFWKPDASFFDHLALDQRIYEALVTECVKHHMNPKSVPKSLGGLFKASDKAAKRWAEIDAAPEKVKKSDADKAVKAYVAALEAVAAGLNEAKPKYGKEHARMGEPHDGYVAYRTSVLARVGDASKGLIKAVNDKHAANAYKS